TDIEKDKVLIAVNIDGGQMLETRADPLATEMVQMLTTGGLGKHSLDDLQTVLAGHEVSTSLANGPDSFVGSARTTPADLALQLRVLAALITDPGYRIEGEQQYRLAVNTYFTQLNATPAAALTNSIGGILSDQDPRFSVQKVEAYRALTFARLKAAIADRLAHGALEVGLVGDVDEARAIALVGATLGALPVREADFRPYAEQRQRPFTAERTERVVRHTGPANQAMLRLTWPTRDDSDPQAKQVLNMLGRVAQVELTENLRQRLGKAYAPSASSDPSRVWRGYGTFAITASVDVADLAVMRAAMLDTVAALRARPVSADIMLRARQPLVESFQNALKSNGGWLALVARAQSQPDRIARHLKAEARLAAVSAGDVQAAARRYLGAGAAVEVAVLPEGAALPAPLQPAPALLAGGDHQA
ncbi:MAG TPA: insulinase family protein, partial [Novosphingobium sp.]|nr:insulinase family protein [Novosphingobium sp.]